MKKRHITLFLAFVLCFSLFAVGVSAVSYNGTATPLMETTTGEYGKLIWKQDFEDAASVGDYRYDIGYVSPYADGASLSDRLLSGRATATAPIRRLPLSIIRSATAKCFPCSERPPTRSTA